MTWKAQTAIPLLRSLPRVKDDLHACRHAQEFHAKRPFKRRQRDVELWRPVAQLHLRFPHLGLL